MSTALARVTEVQEAVLAADKILPRGGATKPALCRDPDGIAAPLDLSGIGGILEYEPEELTVTALAGTPIAELVAVLSEHGQHLPFDPIFTAGGAETLGGAIATGAVGPGAFGGGTIRDFILGVRIVDGAGRSIYGGGRVVKNAAGFDLPKLMVGSLGRLGVIVEASLKLFPSPGHHAALRIERPDIEAAAETISLLSRAPGCLEELDLDPPGAIYLRVSTNAAALDLAVGALERLAGGRCERLDPAVAERRRREIRTCAWVPERSRLVRVPITAGDLASLEALLPAAAPRRYADALNVAWLAWPEDIPVEDLGARLAGAGLRGVLMGGPPGRAPLVGAPGGGAFAERIRATLDPTRRFLELGP